MQDHRHGLDTDPILVLEREEGQWEVCLSHCSQLNPPETGILVQFEARGRLLTVAEPQRTLGVLSWRMGRQRL